MTDLKISWSHVEPREGGMDEVTEGVVLSPEEAEKVIEELVFSPGSAVSKWDLVKRRAHRVEIERVVKVDD